jgi:predicted phage-related endonuclease
MLTELQRRQRAGRLTASRVACLMTGDASAINLLYQQMIGVVPEEDLSTVWPVRLGEATEQLNLDWFELKNAMAVVRRGEVVVHPRHPWAAATLDGWVEMLKCPIEVKHVGGREPIEVVIDRYQPQMQWQMEVTGATQCALSIIVGAFPPVVEFIERDAAYAAEMVKRGEQFMACMHERRPPVAMMPMPAPVDASKVYDYSKNNFWCAQGDIWLANKDAAKAAREAEINLKNVVPEDAKKVIGAGIQITRDKANRLSLREAAT